MTTIEKRFKRWGKNGIDGWDASVELFKRSPKAQRNTLAKLASDIEKKEAKRVKLIKQMLTDTGLAEGKVSHALVRLNLCSQLEQL